MELFHKSWTCDRHDKSNRKLQLDKNTIILNLRQKHINSNNYPVI